MSQIFSVSCVRLCLMFIIPLFLFSTGCAMKNAPVPEDKRIVLSNKTEVSAVYKSGLLTVIYEYQRTGDTFTISGNVEFPQSVDSLDVRIVFLDATGLTLGKKLVYSSGFRSFATADSPRTFRRKIVMPSGATSFFFTESSVARFNHR